MFYLKRIMIIVPCLVTVCFVLLACRNADTKQGHLDATNDDAQNKANNEVSHDADNQSIQITVLDTPVPTLIPIPTPTSLPQTFFEPFDDQSAHPTSWQPATWDVTIHSRDHILEPMWADYGENCEPLPAQHHINSNESSVFSCRGRIMTALFANSYGLIYLTPNALVDFSEQEAIIRFDLSTRRTSPRDWVDLWITPYNDHLQLALDHTLPDLSGEPRQAIHLRMDFGQENENSSGNKFLAYVVNEFEVTALPLNDTRGYEEVLTPDANRLSTFELRLSQDHIKFGLPDEGLWWVDSEIRLDWAEGVIQLGHHSYNPLKDCATCTPNTWHWDNLFISPAKGFTILPANRDLVNNEEKQKNEDHPSVVVDFAIPSPKHSHLRFAGIGNNLQFSVDQGRTWQLAELQIHNEALAKDEHFKSYWTPVSAGVTQVQFRGEEWWGGEWHVRDISIWSLETQ